MLLFVLPAYLSSFYFYIIISKKLLRSIIFCAVASKTGEDKSLIANIEVQNVFALGYPLIKRYLYYCCRMISSQHGREFEKSHYENIQKVYSIWICLSPSQNREHTITRYRLIEERLIGEVAEPVENYDLLSAVILCLGDPNKADYASTLRMLDILLSNEMGAADKQQILQDEFGIPMTRTMEEGASDMCNLSQGVLQKGIVKGRIKGRTEGRLDERTENIRNLTETLGLTVEQAIAALKVPEGENQKYHDLLNQQSN